MQQAIDIAKQSLSQSADFRTFVGAADAAAALLRIHNDVLPAPSGDLYTNEELNLLRPCALVSVGETNYTRNATDGDCWDTRGDLMIDLYRTTPADELNGAKDESFRNVVESIVDYLKSVSHQPGHLNAVSLQTVGPFRTKPNETKTQGDFQMFQIIVRWGDA